MFCSNRSAWVIAGLVGLAGTASQSLGQIGDPPARPGSGPAPETVPSPGGVSAAPGSSHEEVFRGPSGVPTGFDASVPSVLASERATIGLQGFISDPNDPVLVNSGGQTLIKVNTGLMSMGTNADGTEIFGGWSEISLSDTVRAITMVITTDDTFEVAPFGGTPEAGAARLFPDSGGFALGTHSFGVGDAIQFQNIIEELFFDSSNPTNGVFLEEFSNFGAPRTVNLTKLFNGPDGSQWNTEDGGVDFGDLGAGSVNPGSVNTIRVRYVFTVPAPGSAAAGLALLGFAARRRR